VAAALMLAGFLVNAAAVPLASWLPDAYPESSWSGMVFLTAFTTKVSVVVLLRVFPGADVLVPIGLVMALYGIVYAAAESDMRRILAYAIVNQQGLMLVGVGIGSPLALNGAASHAVASVFYTGLLAMATGAVLRETGRRDCGDLGGLWRHMPFTAACAGIGALAFAGAPLASGFVTKSMTGVAAGEAGLDAVRWAIAAASALSLLHAGLKLPWRVFLHRDGGLRPADPPASQRLAMALLAALTLGIGLAPGVLYRWLPFPSTYEPYTLAGALGALATLGAGLFIFWVLRPVLRRSKAGLKDVDEIWRGPGLRLWEVLLAALAAVASRVTAWGARALAGARSRVGPGTVGASLARGWTVRTMVLWVVVALAGMLVLSYR
jgi:multicomponent Na+:H+ antiporter subunit D